VTHLATVRAPKAPPSRAFNEPSRVHHENPFMVSLTLDVCTCRCRSRGTCELSEEVCCAFVHLVFEPCRSATVTEQGRVFATPSTAGLNGWHDQPRNQASPGVVVAKKPLLELACGICATVNLDNPDVLDPSGNPFQR